MYLFLYSLHTKSPSPFPSADKFSLNIFIALTWNKLRHNNWINDLMKSFSVADSGKRAIAVVHRSTFNRIFLPAVSAKRDAAKLFLIRSFARHQDGQIRYNRRHSCKLLSSAVHFLLASRRAQVKETKNRESGNEWTKNRPWIYHVCHSKWGFVDFYSHSIPSVCATMGMWLWWMSVRPLAGAVNIGEACSLTDFIIGKSAIEMLYAKQRPSTYFPSCTCAHISFFVYHLSKRSIVRQHERCRRLRVEESAEQTAPNEVSADDFGLIFRRTVYCSRQRVRCCWHVKSGPEMRCGRKAGWIVSARANLSKLFKYHNRISHHSSEATQAHAFNIKLSTSLLSVCFRHGALEMDYSINNSPATKSYHGGSISADRTSTPDACDVAALKIASNSDDDEANSTQKHTKSTNTTMRMCKKCNCLCDNSSSAERVLRRGISASSAVRMRGNETQDDQINSKNCDVTHTSASSTPSNECPATDGASKLPIIVDHESETKINRTKPTANNHHPTYLPPHFRDLSKTQSLDLADSELPGLLPKVHSFDQTRPIYPNVPFSPYGSPFGSPRIGRRRPPLRESRRISIEQSGSFLQLNQYKLMDQIGQVREFFDWIKQERESLNPHSAIYF